MWHGNYDVQSIVPDSLMHQMFYNLYDEYRELAQAPIISRESSQILAVAEDQMRRRILAADIMLKSFEQQTGLNSKYDAPKILSHAARCNRSSNINITKMYEDYVQMKFWQKMLDMAFFPDDEKEADELTKINSVLNKYGYDYPLGAQGVEDAIRTQQEQLDEIQAEKTSHAGFPTPIRCDHGQLPDDYATQIQQIIFQSEVSGTPGAFSELRGILDWSMFFDKLENFVRKYHVNVAIPIPLSIKDNPQA